MKELKRKSRAAKIDPSPYPKGWNRARVEAIINHYENQSDDEAIAEAEAAYRSTKSAMIQVPIGLVSQVEKLIARKRAS